MFRLKIALLSVLISGSVLVIFGLFFLTVISRVGLDRIDREILTLGESQLHVWHPKRHWQEFDKSLRSIYGQERWEDLIVQVTDAEDQLIYRSPHWPEAITIASFPQFDGQMETGPVAGEFRRGPRGYSAGPGVTARIEHKIRSAAARPPPLLRSPPRIKKPLFLTMEPAEGTWRTGIMGNQHITIMLGMNMSGYFEDAARYKKIFLISVPLALMLMAGGGWWIAHRALKPVILITRTAEKISTRGLDQRISVVGADSEFLRLVQVINDMLGRLETGFVQAVRFSADAAHELQTPLTILQGVLDDAVQNTENGSDEQQRSNDLLEEVQRLKVIVQKLLILSRADAGELILHFEPCDMSGMIESIIEDIGVIAPHLKIEQQISPKVMVQADPELLRQAIQNLSSNSVKYNLKEGLIRVNLRQDTKNVRFHISNSATPISDTERKRIFDRFYRIDKSRSKRVPGSGLGLPLAHEIIRAHKGQLFLEPATDNLITFTLSIPRIST